MGIRRGSPVENQLGIAALHLQAGHIFRRNRIHGDSGHRCHRTQRIALGIHGHNGKKVWRSFDQVGNRAIKGACRNRLVGRQCGNLGKEEILGVNPVVGDIPLDGLIVAAPVEMHLRADTAAVSREGSHRQRCGFVVFNRGKNGFTLVVGRIPGVDLQVVDAFHQRNHV